MCHVLNQYFDKIYCVTVYNFHDRHEFIKKQLNGIEFEWILSPPANSLIPLGYRTPTESSLMYGHLFSIWNAKLNGYKKIAIFEDDCQLIATEDEMKTFFDELPSDWDFLYMANGSWNKGIWDNWAEWSKPYSEHVNSLIWGTGSSFNAIQCQMFDPLAEELLLAHRPIDFCYYHLFKTYGKAYCPSKKFFFDPKSLPHESVRTRFPDASNFLSPRVEHAHPFSTTKYENKCNNSL